MKRFPNLIFGNVLSWEIVVFLRFLPSICMLLLPLPMIAGNSERVSQEDQKFLTFISKTYQCCCRIAFLNLSRKDEFTAGVHHCEQVMNGESWFKILRDHETNLKHFKALLLRFPIPEPNPKDVNRLLADQKCHGCDLRGAKFNSSFSLIKSLSSLGIGCNPALPNFCSPTISHPVDLSSANLSYANFRGMSLNGLNLSQANLRFADLSSARIGDTDFTGADMRNALLGGAILSSHSLLSPHNKVNFQKANLEGASLTGSNLINADLRGVNLRNANLQGAYLRGADLRGADLRGADLTQVTFSNTNLIGADLRGAIVDKGRKLGLNPFYSRSGICYATLSEDIKAQMDCANPNPTPISEPPVRVK